MLDWALACAYVLDMGLRLKWTLLLAYTKSYLWWTARLVRRSELPIYLLLLLNRLLPVPELLQVTCMGLTGVYWSGVCLMARLGRMCWQRTFPLGVRGLGRMCRLGLGYMTLSTTWTVYTGTRLSGLAYAYASVLLSRMRSCSAGTLAMLAVGLLVTGRTAPYMLVMFAGPSSSMRRLVMWVRNVLLVRLGAVGFATLGWLHRPLTTCVRTCYVGGGVGWVRFWVT